MDDRLKMANQILSGITFLENHYANVSDKRREDHEKITGGGVRYENFKNDMTKAIDCLPGSIQGHIKAKGKDKYYTINAKPDKEGGYNLTCEQGYGVVAKSDKISDETAKEFLEHINHAKETLTYNPDPELKTKPKPTL